MSAEEGKDALSGIAWRFAEELGKLMAQRAVAQGKVFPPGWSGAVKTTPEGAVKRFASLLSEAGQADMFLRRLFNVAMRWEDPAAAFALFAVVHAATYNLAALATRNPDLFAWFTALQNTFPLNSAKHSRVQKTNERILALLRVGESSPFVRAKPGSPLQAVAQDIMRRAFVEVSPIVCSPSGSASGPVPPVDSPDGATRWFEQGWASFLAEYPEPEVHPCLRQNYAKCLRDEELRAFKKQAPDGYAGLAGKHTDRDKLWKAATKMSGMKNLRKNQAVALATSARSKLKHRVKEEFLALLKVRGEPTE